MKPELQRIKIAKACGWEILEPEIHPAITYEWAIDPDGNRRIVPDYTEDLNAMHEAKQILTQQQKRDYVRIAGNFCKTPFDSYNLTAEQEVEIFLRALNLWEE